MGKYENLAHSSKLELLSIILRIFKIAQQYDFVHTIVFLSSGGPYRRILRRRMDSGRT